jgi:Flp pilus assembly protein TadG
MRRLSPARLTARLREERGAVAVIVALMMVPLLGCAALAVDIAAVHAEQQQLQNAADAAALAVAADCARADCGSTVATATALVRANGPAPGGTLGTPTVAVDTAGVTVTARATQQHWFAPVLGIGSSEVARTSRVQWAGARTATVLPYAISLCEYRKQVAAQPLTNLVHTVAPLANTGCTPLTGPPAPAGAWVTTPASTCTRKVTVGEVLTQYRAPSATANSVPPACTNALSDLAGTTVVLPVFDVTGTAAGLPTYTVHGFAAFRVDGFTGGSGGSGRWGWLEWLIWLIFYRTPNPDSGGTAPEPPRLAGWFTATATLGDGPLTSTAPDLGVRTVHLVDPKA